MTIRGKQIHIRVPDDLAQHLENLEREFGGVPSGILMKLLLTSFLERPLQDQIELITEQIRKRPRRVARAYTSTNNRRPM